MLTQKASFSHKTHSISLQRLKNLFWCKLNVHVISICDDSTEQKLNYSFQKSFNISQWNSVFIKTEKLTKISPFMQSLENSSRELSSYGKSSEIEYVFGKDVINTLIISWENGTHKFNPSFCLSIFIKAAIKDVHMSQAPLHRPWFISLIIQKVESVCRHIGNYPSQEQ